jgi:hypothetical protein
VILGGELLMVSTDCAWRASAAYLYVLGLDRASLAWEYLRRNPDYQRDWSLYSHDRDCVAKRWQLASLEDPGMDARVVQPLWRPETDLSVRLTADAGDDAGEAARFSLWAIAGRKALVHDGHRLVLLIFLGGRTLRIALAGNVSDGEAFAYVVPAGVRARARWNAIVASRPLLEGTRIPKTSAVQMRPDRVALAHMRSLQALDGSLARASQREIASAIFGRSHVDDKWHADSELRAQTRYLIRRGQALMRGGYGRLVASVACCDRRSAIRGGGR